MKCYNYQLKCYICNIYQKIKNIYNVKKYVKFYTYTSPSANSEFFKICLYILVISLQID